MSRRPDNLALPGEIQLRITITVAGRLKPRYPLTVETQTAANWWLGV